MKYYSVIKKNDVLIQATTWMDLRNMLSERTQKITRYMVLFIINIKDGYQRDSLPGAKTEKNEKWLLNEYEVFFQDNEKLAE